MKTIGIELDESFWGEIKDYTMPAQGIFHVKGAKRMGWIMSPEKAGLDLSDEARALGELRDGWYRFAVPSEEADFIWYELLGLYAGNLTNLFAARVIEDELASLEVYGHVECPEYFWECPPPSMTPSGITQCFKRLCNGVYLARSLMEEYLCIYLPIGDALSAAADEAVSGDAEIPCVENYLFIPKAAALIPVFELRDEYPELRALIADEAALLTELHANHKEYLRRYALIAAGRPVPEAPAVPAAGPPLNWPVLE